jgi:hypothetical protein
LNNNRITATGLFGPRMSQPQDQSDTISSNKTKENKMNNSPMNSARFL